MFYLHLREYVPKIGVVMSLTFLNLAKVYLSIYLKVEL